MQSALSSKTWPNFRVKSCTWTRSRALLFVLLILFLESTELLFVSRFCVTIVFHASANFCHLDHTLKSQWSSSVLVDHDIAWTFRKIYWFFLLFFDFFFCVCVFLAGGGRQLIPNPDDYTLIPGYKTLTYLKGRGGTSKIACSEH